mmetsp:Transcript_7350/g.14284  ORF Transcript_7350/g.14284 Transcript_7350/m.14284 type:complete len:170 (-) Transcript_7350:138-647(-)
MPQGTKAGIYAEPPAYNQAVTQTYAQPQYAQPQYAQPQYAQPQYAQPQYGHQPQYGQQVHQQPQYVAQPVAQPVYAPSAPVQTQPATTAVPVAAGPAPVVATETGGVLCPNCNTVTVPQGSEMYPSVWAWFCCCLLAFFLFPFCCIPFLCPFCYERTKGKCQTCNRNIL